MIHQLKRRQIIPASIDRVWAFFSNPGNLNQITPPDLHFEILQGGERTMYQGQLISYRIQLFPLFKTPWLTEITSVQEPDYFVDQQRQGPYQLWHHEHRFTEVSEGVEMRDLVTYQLPLGPLGDLIQAIYVSSRLDTIFNFRAHITAQVFGSAIPPR